MERTMELNHSAITPVGINNAVRSSVQNVQNTARQVLRDHEFLFIDCGVCSKKTTYSIISSHPGRGMFFEPDLRNVNPFGVDFVMRHFFSGMLAAEFREATVRDAEDLDLICDEERLDPNPIGAEG